MEDISGADGHLTLRRLHDQSTRVVDRDCLAPQLATIRLIDLDLPPERRAGVGVRRLEPSARIPAMAVPVEKQPFERAEHAAGEQRTVCP